MAKRVHNEPTSSKTPLIVMAIGGLLVAALVVWAVTRSVEPVPAETSTTASAPAPSTAPPGGFTPTATDPAMQNTGTLAQPPQTSTLSPLPNVPAATDIVPPPGTMNAEASVARVSAEDLRTQIGRGAVTVIDVRDAASYATGHIAGALHIPFSRVEAELNNIPRNKPIVTYCT
ncbi:MAG TPA: rhodanese-like domain-containing protein [Thermoanaerobaculia bacterium]